MIFDLLPHNVKFGLTEKEILDKCDTKELTRVNSEPNYIDLQVKNEEIWDNLVAILSIVGKGNGITGDYMYPTLYTTICLTPYQKHTNPGKHPYYLTGSTKSAHESIKDNWERNRFEFFTSENRQHAIK